MCASTVPVESARGNVCLRSKTARDHSSRDLSLSLCLSLSEIYGQRATLSVNYKPGDWDSVRAWILKAGSGWHQSETAEDPQNMNNFAAGSLGAVTAHRIKWILSGRSAGEQMRQWQQALQAEQIIDARPKRVSPLSHDGYYNNTNYANA